jgi:hypothetical protein
MVLVRTLVRSQGGISVLTSGFALWITVFSLAQIPSARTHKIISTTLIAINSAYILIAHVLCTHHLCTP